MPHVPRFIRRAYERSQFASPPERCQLHFLPFAASRTNERSLLMKPQPELCYTCHLQQKPEFAMPFHHRVNEGLVQCSDCHNPHGTVLENK